MSIQRLPSATLVYELEQALRRGDGYIMAAFGQNPRTGYLDLTKTAQKSAWRPEGWYYKGQYSGKKLEQALRWRERCTRVWDCNGMAEGIYEIYTGTCINQRARDNYAGWCGVKGAGMIPPARRVPGAAVFWSDDASSSIHHVAYLWKPVKSGHPEGDWYLIEARGVMYGVVQTRLNERKPNFWGWMTKYFDYSATAAEPVEPAATLGLRTLRNGCEGEDVKQMQAALITLGYDLGRWGADGDFGDQTEMAVKAFQRDHALAVDGIAGERTLAAIEAQIHAAERPAESPCMVEIRDGDCYVRSAPNTSGRILGVAKRGTLLPYGGQVSDGGWPLVAYTPAGASQAVNAWVSGKYGKLVS